MTDRQEGRRRDKQTGRQTDIQTHRQIKWDDGGIEKRTNGWIDKQLINCVLDLTTVFVAQVINCNKH
jgi:hypothetical protein